MEMMPHSVMTRKFGTPALCYVSGSMETEVCSYENVYNLSPYTLSRHVSYGKTYQVRTAKAEENYIIPQVVYPVAVYCFVLSGRCLTSNMFTVFIQTVMRTAGLISGTNKIEVAKLCVQNILMFASVSLSVSQFFVNSRHFYPD